MTQLHATHFLYPKQLLLSARGGTAWLTVRACDCGFRNKPQNTTGLVFYCGDNNLREFLSVPANEIGH